MPGRWVIIDGWVVAVENASAGNRSGLSQDRPAAVGTRGVLLKDGATASRSELVELGIGALPLGGDPGIADQTARRVYRDRFLVRIQNRKLRHTATVDGKSHRCFTLGDA